MEVRNNADVDEGIDGETISVFFADDHELVRKAVSGLISEHFANCEIFESGSFEGLEEALAARHIGNGNGHQIILMDLQMPGVSLPKSIYTLIQRYPNLPIVILSGTFSAETAVSVMKIGVKALIPKSSAPQLLLHVLNLVLDGQTYFPVELISAGGSGAFHGGAGLSRLTNRENEVAGLIADGLTNKEIARVLGISDGTVKVAVKSIFRKMGVTNRTMLARQIYDQRAD